MKDSWFMKLTLKKLPKFHKILKIASALHNRNNLSLKPCKEKFDFCICSKKYINKFKHKNKLFLINSKTCKIYKNVTHIVTKIHLRIILSKLHKHLYPIFHGKYYCHSNSTLILLQKSNLSRLHYDCYWIHNTESVCQ